MAIKIFKKGANASITDGANPVKYIPTHTLRLARVGANDIKIHSVESPFSVTFGYDDLLDEEDGTFITQDLALEYLADFIGLFNSATGGSVAVFDEYIARCEFQSSLGDPTTLVIKNMLPITGIFRVGVGTYQVQLLEGNFWDSTKISAIIGNGATDHFYVSAVTNSYVEFKAKNDLVSPNDSIDGNVEVRISKSLL